MASGRTGAGRQKLAKAAMAKVNNVSVDITGIAGDTIAKLGSLSQSLGVTYDGNNNILDHTLNDERASHQLHGVISGMNVSINANPRYFDIAAGVYYINGSRIEYTGGTVDTVTVPGGSFATVAIDSGGVAHLHIDEFIPRDHFDTELELTAFSKADANTISRIGDSFFESLQFVKQVFLRFKLFEGTKFFNGTCAITENVTTPLTLDVQGGDISTPNLISKVVPDEQGLLFQTMYRVGGVYTINTTEVSLVDNLQYDNGDLTALGNNQYVTHTLSRSSRTQTYYLTYGNTEYNKPEEAIEAPSNLGKFEGKQGSEIEPLANIVVEKGAAGIAYIIDLRGGVKVTTTSLASAFNDRITALEARVTALENP